MSDSNSTQSLASDLWLAPEPDFNTVPLQQLSDPILQQHDIDLRVLRLDLADPALGGNKWFKLRENLRQARLNGHDSLLSFGGAWSNHLYALAEVGHRYGLRTIAILRGEIPPVLNPTLSFARERGMQLVPTTRSDYRRRHESAFIEQLQAQYGPAWLIPEGGCNLQGMRGCQALAELLVHRLGDGVNQHIALACGTATTMAGLLAGLWQCCQSGELADMPVVRGYAVLKGADFLLRDLSHGLAQLGAGISESAYSMNLHSHCGGYARANAGLLEFIDWFETTHQIPVEPVYTGKLMAGLYQDIRQGIFRAGSRITVLHSGGLQNRFGTSCGHR
jgi:1-aminocyclopropane-1-carboxylate deaminase